MNYGLYLPNFGDETGVLLATLAREAGVTWWLESLFTERNSLEAMRRRILQGPPR
ncbi:MAG: hypothetical protein ACYDER_06695 [Ktedonobacteraceae bacterium]